jgi:hypothetical protein
MTSLTFPQIVTDYVCPPIPTRAFDWCAYFEGDEEDGPRGWGASKEEAVQNLLDIVDE